jgi:DNA-binding transcriptional LysR family regulator
MSLPSLFLDAFVEVCRTRHFSNAAKNLFITQSALTQRIQKLEEEIHTKFFVRNRSQVSLIEAGE